MSIQTLVRIETTNNHVIDFLQVGKEYRVDSRLVAPNLGLEHKHLLETLRTYQTQLEYFGVMPFETAKPSKGSAGGRPETYVMLNRNQALFAITLSRNTEQVVAWKMALIDALDQLEKQLMRRTTRRPAILTEKVSSKATRETLEVLNQSATPLYPKELAKLLGVPDGTMRGRLFEMKHRGEVKDTGEGYISLVSNGSNTLE